MEDQEFWRRFFDAIDKTQLIKTFDYLTSELEREIGKLLEDYIEFFQILFDKKYSWFI